MAANGTSVSFSTDELVALARRLDLPPLPVLGPGPLDDLAPSIRERVLDAADRSLVARNVVHASDGTVLPVIASLLAIIAKPRVLVRVARRAGDTIATAYFAAGLDVTVEMVPRTYGVHQLRPFPTVDLLAGVLDAAELAERGSASGDAHFDIHPDALTQVYDAVAQTDRDGASAVLAAAGVDAQTVDELLGPEPPAWVMATVAIVHRPEAQRIEGGEVTVIDTRERGLWGVTRVDANRLRVDQTTLEPIARDLLDLLPTR